ncbi:MAG: group I truncated hemoglobin, partial [Pyrinomonadaceae bacterium]
VALCMIGVLSAGASAQDMMAKKSLYERLGGLEAIKAVIGDFAGRVLADPSINKKFAKTDPERLTFMLVQQVCDASGGPCKYTGRSMKDSHKNMGVTGGEFNALVGHLVATLDKFKVGETEKNELLGVLGPMKPDIVEVNSMETGTALPANFKPAKKLSKKTVAAGPANKTMKNTSMNK